MNLSKNVSKRVRPLLGTFVEITLFGDADFSSIITMAFERAHELEKIFNCHDPESEISLYNSSADRLNFKKSSALSFVLSESLEIFRMSGGAFSPYSPDSCFLDLNGLSKGYIVDQIVGAILNDNPAHQGLVNAGGDLRFFNCTNRTIDIRLNSTRTCQITILKNAMATSSLNTATNDKKSSSQYSKQLRSGLTLDHTVSVIAQNCMLADALTKVALFADFEVVQKCAMIFKVDILVFDAHGELKEIFKDHES